MAVYFRHGSNGAYKTAYVVWFEILPALRAGRLVVTNVEGMRPMESIEKALGEKFPPGAQLIRIFSREDKGVTLWQNWFSWMPCGALVVIDECQDLYTADVGFKREKAQRQTFETFKDMLPDGFTELFYSRWSKVDPSTLDEMDEDDTGGTQLDEEGRLLYPNNFYGAFMRHRKYQWDIIMLTPDWTAIPTWLRGCAQEAYSHRSTDTFFRKRRPRIFNHRPNSTKTAPTTKSDYASCTSKKVPIDVHALYKSTGTGGFNESKSDITILKSPKFLLSLLVCLGSFIWFFWTLSNVLSDSNQEPTTQAVEVISSTQSDNQVVTVQGTDTTQKTNQSTTSLGIGRSNTKVASETDIYDDVNPFFEHFSVFNGATHVYISSIEKRYRNGRTSSRKYLFQIVKEHGDYYIHSDVLRRYGYDFLYLDDCLVEVMNNDFNHMLTCPPYDNSSSNDSPIAQVDTSDRINKVDIFNLSGS